MVSGLNCSTKMLKKYFSHLFLKIKKEARKPIFPPSPQPPSKHLGNRILRTGSGPVAQLSTGAERGPKSAHGPKIEREGYLKNALNIDKKVPAPPLQCWPAQHRTTDRQTDRLLKGPRPSRLLGSEQLHVMPGWVQSHTAPPQLSGPSESG